MSSPQKISPQSFWCLAGILLIGLAARLAAAAHGYNDDMRAYFIVAKIMAHGGNVYAETTRYNYGPVWFLLVHALDVVAQYHEIILRWLIAGFLSLVDVGIFILLYRQAGPLAAGLFFLNPISIIVTGYHSQFDNFAVGIGLLGALQVGRDSERPLARRDFIGLLLLGLSLVIKHDLFLFPVWLALKRRGWLEKFLVVAVPSGIFLAAFLPWWAGSQGGIVRNVFEYRSNYSSYFYSLMLPEIGRLILNCQGWWLLALILFAFACRAKDGFHSLLFYTGVLVAFSPAATNQYLAIPVMLVSVCHRNPFFIGYTLLGAYHLCADGKGLHLMSGLSAYDALAIYSLCFGLAWELWPQIFAWPVKKIREEMRFQLGREK